MKAKSYAILGLVVIFAVACYTFMAPEAKWSGVDEAVVKKFAEEAGRPPREPFINTGEGDLLLFCFLCAGALGGFVAGYYFRELFPPRVSQLRDRPDV